MIKDILIGSTSRKDFQEVVSVVLGYFGKFRISAGHAFYHVAHALFQGTEMFIMFDSEEGRKISRLLKRDSHNRHSNLDRYLSEVCLRRISLDDFTSLLRDYRAMCVEHGRQEIRVGVNELLHLSA